MCIRDRPRCLRHPRVDALARQEEGAGEDLLPQLGECERQLGYLPPLQKQLKEKAVKEKAKAAVSEEAPVDPFVPTEEERVTPKLWLATLRSIIGQRYVDPDKLSERDKRNYLNIPEDIPMEDTTQYLCFGLFIEDTDDEGKNDTQWITLSDIIHMVGVEKTSRSRSSST